MAELSPDAACDGLTALIRTFDQDRAGTLMKLRDWLAKDREGFYRGTVEAVRSGEDSRAIRSLVELLMGAGMLEEVLCDQELSLQDAVTVGRLAMEVDARTDASLARSLAESLAEGDIRCALTRAPRLISVLSEISDGSRILPSLARLLHNANPYLRSKLVLMIARANRSTNWVQSRMADPDPRIRANAVEALWGFGGWHTRELLLMAARDSNNRVVGNALLGLYRLGDCSMLAEAVNLTGHTSHTFRGTAAWLMGETGDDRFRTALAGLLQDPVPMVRSRALKALGRIRIATEKASRAEECRVAGFFVPGEGDRQQEMRRVRVAVTGNDGKAQLPVLPVEFRLSADGAAVMSYKVAEITVPDSLPVVFVMPRGRPDADRPWITAALNCLNWKRSADRWALVPWTSRADVDAEGAGMAADYAPAFQGNTKALESTFNAGGSRRDCPDFWHALCQAVKTARTTGAGKGYVLALCHESIAGIAGPELVGILSASRVPVQVISAAENRALEALCRQTGTNFRTVGDAEAMVAAIEGAYLALLGRYEVAYQAAQAGYLEIRVRTAGYSGQTTILASG